MSFAAVAVARRVARFQAIRMYFCFFFFLMFYEFETVEHRFSTAKYSTNALCNVCLCDGSMKCPSLSAVGAQEECTAPRIDTYYARKNPQPKYYLWILDAPHKHAKNHNAIFIAAREQR